MDEYPTMALGVICLDNILILANDCRNLQVYGEKEAREKTYQPMTINAS